MPVSAGGRGSPSAAAGLRGARSSGGFAAVGGFQHRAQDVDQCSSTPLSASTGAGSSIMKSSESGDSTATSGRLPSIQIPIEEALQRQQQRFDEAIAALAAARVSEESFVTNSLKSLERKVTKLSGEVASQCGRLSRIEKLGGFHSQDSSHCRSQGVLQLQPEKDVVQLLGAQQDEIAELQGQLRQFHERFSSLETSPTSFGRKEDIADDEGSVAPQSLELQLRELVLELRKLQQEQQQRADMCGVQPQLHAEAEAAISGAASVLKELTEERNRVSDMLDNVRQEKLEVIAMMHSFVVGKDEALRELKGVHRTFREELRLEATRSRATPPPRRQESAPLQIVSSELQGMPRAEVLTIDSNQRDRMVSAAYRPFDEPDGHVHVQTLQRQPTSHATMAPLGPLQCQPSSHNATLSAGQSHVAVAGAVQAVHQSHQSTLPWRAPQSERARSLAVSPPPAVLVATANAPAPQQSVSCATVSPIMRMRSTACDMRGPSPVSATDTRHCTVRRIVSAGMSPRTSDPSSTAAQSGNLLITR